MSVGTCDDGFSQSVAEPAGVALRGQGTACGKSIDVDPSVHPFVHPFGRIGWTKTDLLDAPPFLTRNYLTQAGSVDMPGHSLKVAARVGSPVGQADNRPFEHLPGQRSFEGNRVPLQSQSKSSINKINGPLA